MLLCYNWLINDNNFLYNFQSHVIKETIIRMENIINQNIYFFRVGIKKKIKKNIGCVANVTLKFHI